MTAALMIQGTASEVGKSLLVAGLCRLFARRGLRVAPFKPLNMSNNAAVAADGGEIGRSQALQALAAGRPASVHFNPLLLKPQAGGGAQVVVQGQVVGTTGAADRGRRDHQAKVMESYRLICGDAELVLVEGAGAAIEPNLRTGSVANMGFAAAANLPVVVVADIDRGGVFASLLGTHLLLDAGERRRVRGFVVNKFRGDPALFADGAADIARRTGWPAVGVVPWFAGLDRLPGEDAVGFERLRSPADGDGIRIAVPGLPYIANFDDLDPLAAEPDVDLRIVRPGSPLPADTDLVILPGSKATLADLTFLREQEWDVDLRAHVRRGGHVLGLCAGLQMLGHGIADPGGIEGLSGRQPGLGLLELETELTADKRLANVDGIELHSGTAVRGYEMHVGRSRGAALARPMLQLAGRPDGAVSPDGRVMGCYLHGLFSADGFRHAFLQRFRPGRLAATRHAAAVEAVLDDWAAHLARHLPADDLLKIAGHTPSSRRSERHAAATLFDSYLIVDWSAASGRNTGKDSIWFCLLQRQADRLEVTALENPPLRALALARLRALLADLTGAGHRVLAGFDFPNGYPRGFAARAGFAAGDDASPPWRAVWDGLAALIEDGPDNKNNRFHAAAALNRRISGGAVPFWGHPHQHHYDDLQPKPVAPAESVGLPTRRLCEPHVPKAKTCWQLAYNGGVGSQTLLGIPVQRALRDDPALVETTRVWPFETGLTVPHPDVRVLLAEVYPSLFGVGPRQARDRWQVENTARRLAERDAQGLLALDLAGPEDLGPAERDLVEVEEGWILGAGTCNVPGP